MSEEELRKLISLLDDFLDAWEPYVDMVVRASIGDWCISEEGFDVRFKDAYARVQMSAEPIVDFMSEQYGAWWQRPVCIMKYGADQPVDDIRVLWPEGHGGYMISEDYDEDIKAPEPRDYLAQGNAIGANVDNCTAALRGALLARRPSAETSSAETSVSWTVARDKHGTVSLLAGARRIALPLNVLKGIYILALRKGQLVYYHELQEELGYEDARSWRRELRRALGQDGRYIRLLLKVVRGQGYMMEDSVILDGFGEVGLVHGVPGEES